MKTYGDLTPRGVGYPASSRPSLRPNNIDGPLLVFRDGQMHWLTAWERFLLLWGLTDADRLERKRRPNLWREEDHAPPNS